LTGEANVYRNALNLEIDNHADTHCFGKNFRPLQWSDTMCTVSPFLDEYTSMENVEICTGATAWTDDNGQVFILVFGQGLWFGERMNKSLINPNQCRAFGTSVCDDPTDPHRSLGFHTEETTIPLRMDGSIALTSTRCPTHEELDTCRHIHLSDESNWDPSHVTYGIHAMKEEQRSTNRIAQDLQSQVFISDVPSGAPPPVPSEPPTFRISALTQERHHTLTAEGLAKKWNIGLRTARNTIKATTQLGVRSAIGPLTRRYRTDLLQSKYRRLNTTFYTDTLFAKCKSIAGNSVAQIYTDGKGFVHVDPRSSKSLAGLTLDAFAEDIGIPRCIIFDGAAEQTGKNSNFQKSIGR
jgi:hypothetical protein